MSSNNFDAIVVGGGPSGAMAAYELAYAGYKVAILEKERLPRYKTCGGGVVYRARKSIPFAINQVVEREYFRASFLVNGRQYDIERPIPIISMVMRDKFDELLLQQAVKMGAKLMEASTVEGLDSGLQYTVQTGSGNYGAKYIVAADGVYSPVAKMTGIPDHRFLIPALESEVYPEAKDFDNLARQVIFDIDIIDWGYGWIFPKRDHLSIGVASLKRGKRNLQEIYQTFLKKWKINRIRHEKRHGFQIPVSPRNHYFKDNIFLVGDAAGLADPLVAEGISGALLSGKLAAKAIIQDDCDCGMTGKVYHDLLQQHILKQFPEIQRLSRLFFEHPTFRNMIFRWRGQSLGEWFTDVFLGEKQFPQGSTQYLHAARKLIYPY